MKRAGVQLLTVGNPDSIVTVTAFYLHLCPFSRQGIGWIEQQLHEAR